MFVNELIPADAASQFEFSAVDRNVQFLVPSVAWAIDLDEDVFLRVVQPFLGKTEPGDANAAWEKPFHFHWKGFDFLASTRAIDASDLVGLPSRFVSGSGLKEGAGRPYLFYLLSFREIRRPPDKDEVDRGLVLSSFQEALASACGGAFVFASVHKLKEPRFGVVKISPDAEVPARAFHFVRGS